MCLSKTIWQRIIFLDSLLFNRYRNIFYYQRSSSSKFYHQIQGSRINLLKWCTTALWQPHYNSLDLLDIQRIFRDARLIRSFTKFHWMILPCLWFFQKILLFPEMRVTRKTFTRVAAFFLLIDFPAIFFFAFFLLFLLFVFWNEKYIFWYTLDFPGEWVIKNFLPGRFLETRLLFFTLHIANLQFESQ